MNLPTHPLLAPYLPPAPAWRFIGQPQHTFNKLLRHAHKDIVESEPEAPDIRTATPGPVGI